MPVILSNETKHTEELLKAAKMLIGTYCPGCGSANCGRLKRSSIEKLLSNATLGFYGTRKYRCFNCLDTFFK